MKESKMDLLILNTDLEIVDIIDTFQSLIWTERYNGYGDFEIYMSASEELVNTFASDRYIRLTDSNRIMVIEDTQIKTDVENEDKLIIKGRSAESILDRRIIWAPTILSGSLQNGIQTLLNDNLISPSILERAIPNFVFEISSDLTITALTVEAQYARDELYESIEKLCVSNNIGFKVTLDDVNNKLVFLLYAGVDRSYDQLTNPYVVFSKEFDNIINSDYSKSTKTLKNVTVVAGEGDGDARKTKVVGDATGIERREMYTDASNVSQTVDSVVLSDDDYYAQLEQKGNEDLAENVLESSFDSQIDYTRTYKYGEDYFLGDIIQIVNGYGIQAKAQVTEIIRSQNESGIEMYPTFVII
jgi:hypothetical protein